MGEESLSERDSVTRFSLIIHRFFILSEPHQIYYTVLQWVIFRKYDSIIYYVTMGYISQIWQYNILCYNGLYFADMTI